MTPCPGHRVWGPHDLCSLTTSQLSCTTVFGPVAAQFSVLPPATTRSPVDKESRFCAAPRERDPRGGAGSGHGLSPTPRPRPRLAAGPAPGALQRGEVNGGPGEQRGTKRGIPALPSAASLISHPPGCPARSRGWAARLGGGSYSPGRILGYDPIGWDWG